MSLPRRRFLRLASSVIALPAVSRIARAQAYPSRPITIVVGFAAGGPDDTSARILAERMRNLLGQSIVIENVTGAGGSIGAGRVARAPADGYTIAFGDFSTHAVNSALYSLSYDIVNDFEPICLTNNGPFLLVARNSIPATNFSEFIKFLRTNPSKATAGTAGVGSVAHVLSILLEKETGSKFQMIPYRGNALALQDLVAGQIDFMWDPPATSMGHIRDKRIKAFAITDTRRLPAAPDIPTRGDRVARTPFFILAVAVSAKRNSKGYYRYPQCCDCQSFRGTRYTLAICGTGPQHIPQSAADS